MIILLYCWAIIVEIMSFNIKTQWKFKKLKLTKEVTLSETPQTHPNIIPQPPHHFSAIKRAAIFFTAIKNIKEYTPIVFTFNIVSSKWSVSLFPTILKWKKMGGHTLVLKFKKCLFDLKLLFFILPLSRFWMILREWHPFIPISLIPSSPLIAVLIKNPLHSIFQPPCHIHFLSLL